MKNLLIITFFLINGFLFSQEKPKVYPEKYLPENLDDALNYMDFSWKKADKKKFKSEKEQTAVSNLHFGYGMYIRNAWLRHGNPKLEKSFAEIGIYALDDISSIILTSFHRKLNKKEIKLEEQIKRFKEYWGKIKKETDEEHINQFNKFKIGDTLTFKYLRTFVDDEQEKQYREGNCRAKGILLEKTQSDFSLKIKLIEVCDNKGIITVDFRNKTREELEFENKKVEDIFWNFYNDWEPNTE
jgi:hypothetical protein